MTEPVSHDDADLLVQKMPRRVPMIGNWLVRMLIGLGLLVVSIVVCGLLSGRVLGPLWLGLVMLPAWWVAILLTDKYTHKYPQRYVTYVVSSHFKGGMIMLVLLGILTPLLLFGGLRLVAMLWIGFAGFTVLDFLAALPSRRDLDHKPLSLSALFGAEASKPVKSDDPIQSNLQPIHGERILEQLDDELDAGTYAFAKTHLPTDSDGCDKVKIIDDLPDDDGGEPVGLIVGRVPANHICRLNRFMGYCMDHMVPGGYLLLRYLPLENQQAEIRRQHTGWTYWPAFLWFFFYYRMLPKFPWLDVIYFSPLLSWVDKIYLSVHKQRQRVLSKAELWGRLAFFGISVVAETEGDGEHWVIAKRDGVAYEGRTPSYYMVIGLQKLALDGRVIYTHKVRSMYPFSEFLQKRIFEDHGLAETGKFKNDFRLTDVGPLIRRLWLDELPQIYDWLRGDIKIVGIRATSRHFLSLYPKHFLELYFDVKPGLIPPLFDETTGGDFDKIVQIEMDYLEAYIKKPILTDISLFYQTFRDIFLRGIRSK